MQEQGRRPGGRPDTPRGVGRTAAVFYVQRKQTSAVSRWYSDWKLTGRAAAEEFAEEELRQGREKWGGQYRVRVVSRAELRREGGAAAVREADEDAARWRGFNARDAARLADPQRQRWMETYRELIRRFAKEHADLARGMGLLDHEKAFRPELIPPLTTSIRSPRSGQPRRKAGR